MGKVASRVIVVLVVLGLALCSLVTYGAKSEKVRIGIEVYDNTDLQQQAINKYLTKYLGPAFNVEFVISDAIKDSNGEISFLENCASKGVKGIITFYQVTDRKILYDKCRELNLYYIIGAGNPTPEELKAAKGNPYFLGGIGEASGDYSSSYEMAKTFLEGGARKFGIATGGKDFGIKLFKDRYQGFMAAIRDFQKKHGKSGISVTEFGGYPNDAWFASQAKMISSAPDAIFATFSGEVLWIQPLTSMGKAGKIKLGTISSMNAVAAKAMADGKLNYLGAIYPQMVGPSFALLYNAVTGYAKDFRDKGKPVIIDQSIINIKSADSMNKWLKVINAVVPPYSASDLKKVCKKFNRKATLADLIKLSKANGYNDIMVRRAAGK